ncbi:alpha/beta hydrolase [Streptomyces albus]|uniref:alpha/beta hydrolase n=1 Tax=Streptomyces albus TaxID=1888 RepID=UPI0033D9F75F
MSHVVMCHGIGYQYKHRETSLTEWYGALRTSMSDAAHPVPEPERVSAVFYGNCYRSLNTKSVGTDDEFADIPPLRAGDVRDPVESALLDVFAQGTEAPAPGGKGATQAALRRLERSEALGRPSSRVVIWLVRQVRRYLDADDTVRACAQQRFARVVTPDTKVVVAHSLGSVVAYEALCAHPEWNVDTFVTLGSPLGLGLIRERLRPAPGEDGGHTWPHVGRWINVAADEDPVALVKKLGPVFGDKVEDRLVVNLPWFDPKRYVLGGHSVMRYLTTGEVADAVAEALRAQKR